MKPFTIISLLCILVCVSCVEYTPKPRGYYRVELLAPDYIELPERALPYSFLLSKMVTVELPSEKDSIKWINLSYPSLNVKIYCNYLRINPKSFFKAEQDCRSLVERQLKYGGGVTEQAFANPEAQVFATVFRIGGETVSPIQFMITDSVSHFFRGALYYDCRPNQDSLVPVTQYLESDIKELIQSFRWKK